MTSSLLWVTDTLLGLSGIAAAAGGLYLLVLALAALRYREPNPSPSGLTRLTVLVPACNESALIQRSVRSLKLQQYPPDRFELVVVADNCTDDTAQLAREAGARVLVRDEPAARGKGRALRWAMDTLIAEGNACDAFVVVDADSVADDRLLGRLAGHFDFGAEAVQGEYLVLEDAPGRPVPLRSVALLLFHRVRFAGRTVLGLPCSLVGNGMLLGRDLMQRHPWDAFSGAEDLEFSVTLRMLGVRPVFAGSALVRGPMAVSKWSVQRQRERWEGGRIHIACTSLPQLIREVLIGHRWSLLDLVVDLATPPLGLLAGWALIGAVVSAGVCELGACSVVLLVPWAVALVSVVAFVTVGLRAARAPLAMYRSLLSTPRFLLRKFVGTWGVFRSRSADTWVRTERPGEVA